MPTAVHDNRGRSPRDHAGRKAAVHARNIASNAAPLTSRLPLCFTICAPMPPLIDARIPLTFAAIGDAGPRDALLIEGEGASASGRDYFQPDPTSGHPANCVCCTPRNGAGMALARLMLARGRGSGLFFDRVIAVTQTEAGKAAILNALDQDPLASACFRQ